MRNGLYLKHQVTIGGNRPDGLVNNQFQFVYRRTESGHGGHHAMQISLCQFLCVFNGVGLIASGDQSAQSVLCLLGQSGNTLQQFLLDRGIYTSGGDRA